MINSNKNIILVIIASFLAQIVQVGAFSILLTQILSMNNTSLSLIGWFVGIQWLSVLIAAPLIPKFSFFTGLVNANKISGLITLSGVIFLFIGNTFFFVLSAIFIGIGLIIRWVVCDTLVVHLSNKDRVGQNIGIHETLMGFGIAIGPLLFTVLTVQEVIYAMMIIVIVSTMFFFFCETIPKISEAVKEVSLEKRDFLIVKIALIAAFLGGFIETAAVAFFPFYFEADGFSLESSAWFVSAFGLGGTLLQLPLGYMVDRIGYRRAYLVSGFFAAVSLLMLYLTLPHFILIYAILFFLGGAVGAFNTLAVIQAGSEITQNKSASAMAYIAVFYTVGSIIGPIITAKTLNYLQADAVLVVYFIFILIISFVILFDFMKNKKALREI